MHTELPTSQPRKCDFCTLDAVFDAKTMMGPWAYMCSMHMEAFGIRLGMGLGSKIDNRT
jgi:hypothetical protein